MEREEACDWYPTPNLRMCLGILQQQFRRVLVDYRHYNGSSRPMRCQSAETEWRDVRQATDQEIAEIRARAEKETPAAPAEPDYWLCPNCKSRNQYVTCPKSCPHCATVRPDLKTVPAPEASLVEAMRRSPRRVQETGLACSTCGAVGRGGSGFAAASLRCSRDDCPTANRRV